MPSRPSFVGPLLAEQAQVEIGDAGLAKQELFLTRGRWHHRVPRVLYLELESAVLERVLRCLELSPRVV